MTRSTKTDLTSMPSTARLAKNTGWNLLGMTLPMVVAVAAIPLLIEGLGNARFGVLSLVWVMVGYFSIFDFGLGRALTRMTAERLGKGRHDEVPAVFWTSLITMALIGTAGAAIIAILAPWLSFSALKIETSLQAETCQAFYLVAACTPVVVTTVGLIGMLEAYQRFRLLNFIRIPMGIFTFVGPLMVLPFTSNMMAIVGVLLAGRIAICLLYFAAILRSDPALKCRPVFDRGLIRPLITFGGWMTISNLVVPLMIQMDRMLLGAWVSVVAVSFYTASSEVVVKLLILPRAWVSTLFPVFAGQYEQRPQETLVLFGRAVKQLLLVLFPAIFVMVTFADIGLNWWLGPEYARETAPVMVIMSTGMLFYGLAYIPYSFLQGIGRPKWSAISHLIELPLFIGAAYLLTARFGISGMAWAWAMRAVLDMVLMFGFSFHFLRRGFHTLWPAWLALMLAVGACMLVHLSDNLSARTAIFLAVIAAWLLMGWFVLLSGGERAKLLAILLRNRNPAPGP